MIYVKLRENYPNTMLVLATGEFIKTNPNPKKDNDYFPINRDSYELKELLRQGILILKKDNEDITEQPRVEQPKAEDIAKSNDVEQLKIEDIAKSNDTEKLATEQLIIKDEKL
jgi:hypothetical protein